MYFGASLPVTQRFRFADFNGAQLLDAANLTGSEVAAGFFIV
jgi:hypothetical protein